MLGSMLVLSSGVTSFVVVTISVGQTAHFSKLLMAATGDASGPEVGILEVGAVSSIRHAIIYKELHHNLISIAVSIRDVLSTAAKPVAISLNSSR